MRKIRKGDAVVVLTGKDKGKTGEVVRCFPSQNRVVVRGVNMVKRHQRATRFAAGGVIEKEAALQVSNVAHLDPRDRKPTRVGVKVLEDGRKVRVCKRSGEVLDA